MFAQMDILDGEDYYNEWFKFLDTDTLNQNFDLFGIGDMNFVYNSGSYFILGVGIFVFSFCRYVTNRICTFFANRSFFRKVGIMFYRKSYMMEIRNAHLKLFMESYFDLAFCALLNFLSFYANKDYTIAAYFQTNEDIACSTITFIYFVIIFVFPLYGYILIMKNLDDHGNLRSSEKVEVFIEDVRTDT